jgi:hypothetical protein
LSGGGIVKQPYETPVVKVIGSLHELTLGSASGNFTDQAFPAGTAFKSLTFSG